MKKFYFLLLVLFCKITSVYVQISWKDFPIQQDQTQGSGNLQPAKKTSTDQSLCSKCFDMFRLSDREFTTLKDTKTFCVRLLQVKRCAKKIKKEFPFCNGIGMMTLTSGIKLKRRRYSCYSMKNISAGSEPGIFKENQIISGSKCKYVQPDKNLSESKHCGMFGDPHLRTFSDVRQTCVVAGAWSLLDNDFLAVQVTNEAVQTTESTTATATTKVSIVFKEIDSTCTTQKIYEATSVNLPAIFKDGTKFSGTHGCRTEIFKPNADHIYIESCHANASIIIRRVGNYLTFNIKLPFEIANKTTGLCHAGCPLQELVDSSSFFENRLNDVLSNRDEAIKICSEANLTDFYYDSCVFDLLTTGDKRFNIAANGAMMDAISLDPKLRLRRENSMVLNIESRLIGKTSIGRTLRESSLLILFFYLLWLFLIR